MLEKLNDLQRDVLARFRSRTDGIPPDLAEVRVEYGSVPAWDLVEALSLEVTPLAGTRCPFSAIVQDGIAYVVVGRGQLDYFWYVDKNVAAWPEWIEQDLCDAIYGRVKEIEWKLGRFQIQLDTLHRGESGQWEHLHTFGGLPGLDWLWSLLARRHVVTEIETVYEPYVEPAEETC